MKEMNLDVLLERGVTEERASEIRSFISMIKGVYAITYHSNPESVKACNCKEDKIVKD